MLRTNRLLKCCLMTSYQHPSDSCSILRFLVGYVWRLKLRVFSMYFSYSVHFKNVFKCLKNTVVRILILQKKLISFSYFLSTIILWRLSLLGREEWQTKEAYEFSFANNLPIFLEKCDDSFLEVIKLFKHLRSNLINN